MGTYNFGHLSTLKSNIFSTRKLESVLTDTVIYLSDQHLTWLSQLKPNAKVGLLTYNNIHSTVAILVEVIMIHE